jgi:hypothetical protein
VVTHIVFSGGHSAPTDAHCAFISNGSASLAT